MTVRRVLLGVLMLLAGAAGAAEPLRFGVLAARPQEVMQPQFQPLADSLSAALGGRPVTLHLLDPDQLEDALDRHKKEMDAYMRRAYGQMVDGLEHDNVIHHWSASGRDARQNSAPENKASRRNPECPSP